VKIVLDASALPMAAVKASMCSADSPGPGTEQRARSARTGTRTGGIGGNSPGAQPSAIFG
jgi:hypothetical protein